MIDYEKLNIEELKTLAEGGDAEAMFHCACYYVEMEADTETALRYLRTAIDLENTNAMCKYGEMLLDGVGVDVDEAEGLKHLAMAADGGNLDAMNRYINVSLFFLSNDVESEIDMRKLRRYCSTNPDNEERFREVMAGRNIRAMNEENRRNATILQLLNQTDNGISGKSIQMIR